jgi:hypothetical protein
MIKAKNQSSSSPSPAVALTFLARLDAGFVFFDGGLVLAFGAGR